MRPQHWLYTLPLRLKSILLGRRVERELDEELQFHLEHKIEEGIANGLSPKEARYAAMRAMDGLEHRKEEMRDMRRIHWLTDFLDDARFAVRSLRRTSGLTAFVVITLALGIGMTSATFSMVDALIFRPYPVPRPSGVVTLASTTHDSNLDDFSYREYLDIRGKTKSCDGVIANANMEAVGFSAEPGATPRVRGGMMVSGNYFHVLGVEPRLGRGFREDEDQVPGRNAVVVLGPDFWKHEFASDPGVIGRTIRLNGTDFTVIGVAPQTFSGMMIFGHPDFYMPLAMARVFSTNLQKNFFEDRDDRELNVKGRLKPSTTMRQARNELAMLAKDFEREYPKVNRSRGAAVYTQFEARTIVDGNWRFGVIFMILALAVLLVACTNVAGLLLSRARARTREIAVRLAIGAGRFRLIRLLLTESLMLLTASFLMVRGFQHDLQEGTGFAKDHLLMASFDPRLVQYNASRTQQFYKLLAERIRLAPGVASEALTQNIPLGTDDFDSMAFVPEGFQMPRDRENFSSTMDTVDEGYFETMGIPILRGRGFLVSDTADAPRVAVVNEQFAKHYWPGGDAAGQHIRLDSRAGTLVEIVGVAQTIKYQSGFERPMDFVYMPLAQHPIARMTLMLRSSGDPLQLVQPVKDVVRTLDPNLPMLQTRSYEDFYLNKAVKV